MTTNGSATVGTDKVKMGLAQMLKGGVIYHRCTVTLVEIRIPGSNQDELRDLESRVEFPMGSTRKNPHPAKKSMRQSRRTFDQIKTMMGCDILHRHRQTFLREQACIRQANKSRIASRR
eukprot:scaffold68937_cov50-Attheya_sp.AAC.1